MGDNPRKLQAKLRHHANMELRHSLFNLVSRVIEESPVYISCLNCIHFKEETETCGLANGMRPPARIIAYGCKQWEDVDEIPF